MGQFTPADDGPAYGAEPPELQRVLESVRHNAVALLATLVRQPSSLRIRAGEVTVEAEWSGGRHPIEAGSASGVDETVTGPPGQPAVDTRQYVCSPSVGVFYRSPEPGAKPFVVEGDQVVPGQQVAIVETMKLMIPVTTDTHGTVAEVLRADGEPVEYGERLFALEQTESGR